MSLKDEFKKFIHPYDDEDEPVEYQEDDYQDRPRRDDRREERRDEERRSKVVNIHATTQLKVVLVKPSKYDEDATAIADHLLEKRTVVVNMENTDPDTGCWTSCPAWPMLPAARSSAWPPRPISPRPIPWILWAT